MNKKNIIALVLGASLVSGGAFAAFDNTITFREVTDETCSVAVNGNSASGGFIANGQRLRSCRQR